MKYEETLKARVGKSHKKKVKKMARKECEGNESMAVRKMIEKYEVSKK